MKILLVDDDAEFVALLLAGLSDLPGHDVRAATNAGMALQAAASMGGVDLLISDVVMEPMNGFVLREQILKRFPAARVIFISGFDLSDYAEQTRFNQVVQKPFELATLLAAMEREFAPPTPVVATPAVVKPVTARLAKSGVIQPFAPVGTPAVVAVGRVARVVLPSEVGAAPASAVRAPVESAVADTPEALIGTTLGSYHVISLLGKGTWGNVYAAIQISINREVGLKILDGAQARDPEQKARFIANARAKAHVQHPSILSVYEAGEIEGRIFYAHEYVDGLNLAEFQNRQKTIDEPGALKVLRAVGDGLAYLHTHKIAHSPLLAAHIYVAVGGQTRLSNIAVHQTTEALTPELEIQALGRIMLSVVGAAQALSPGLRTLLSRMIQTGPNAITGWGPLLQGIKALEPKVVPVEAARMSAQDQAAIAAVEAARKAQKTSLRLTVTTMALTLIVVTWGVWYKVFRSNERHLNTQIHIPAGDYIVGDNEKVHLDQFWIDKYEVTIGQYAKFLEYLATHPTAEGDFNHEKQPRQLDHRPEYWDIYYTNAVRGETAHGVPMSLNSPMITATWWDAYAYAKWKGRELPTEQEWEAAARGPQGLLYPWGNQFDPKRVNANGDFNPQKPDALGTVDGFNFWGDADMMKGDKSYFDVVGMAGNVSEWVAWPKKATAPVYKGGNYTSADVRLDKRVADHPANKGEEFIGFRTITRTPPLPK
ncbi:MAG: Serine/threonine protein kinase [Chthoniobacteraceae bacterium]|nr:Serine/threonine protein kinase [Chthoniobacteraceae bacterium]